MSEKEHIEDVPHGSEKEQEVLEGLQASFLDRKFDSSWRPAKVQLITNNILVEEYQEKKQDFLVRGRKGDELKEKYGFFVENNVAILELITRMGLQGRDSEYNALGYNRMGVYLCKHADVCLQHTLVKHSGSLVMRMVMCKYVAGRPTTAIPRVASAAEFIEPTQGFDCHESVINPDPRDSLQNKFDRSQVYLYEINKLLQPSPRPRQVQPFAVVSFTQNGAYLPIIDAEATAAERMASTVAQQNIANIINSKETLTPQPGAAAVMSANPGQGIIGPAVVVAGPQAPSPQNGTPPAVVTPIASGIQQNGINGHTVSPTGAVDPEKDPVKNAVTQLNVKLGSDIIKRDIFTSASPAGLPRRVTPSPAPAQAQPTMTNQVNSIAGPILSSQMIGQQNRLVRLPNGVAPGGMIYQPLPGMAAGASLYPGLAAGASPYPGMVAAGASPYPGMTSGASPFPGIAAGASPFPGIPAGLTAMSQPGLFQGQPGLVPGQLGVNPGQPGLLATPPGLFQAPAGLVPGHPGLVQGLPAQPGFIQGLPGLLPGGAGQQMLFPMSMPSSVGKPPGFPIFSGASGLMGPPGAAVKTTTAATQLAQSRPITPEVPTAGYVANNVSGYTPAIMGGTAGSPNIGQPIPVLANGTVQNLPASQQPPGAQPTAAGLQHMMTAGGLIQGVPGIQMLGNMPGAAVPNMMAAFPGGLASHAVGAPVPQFTYVNAGGQMSAPAVNAPVPQFTYVAAGGHQLGAAAVNTPGVQKIGQNGLLQPAVLPMHAIPGAPAAQSLKRPITDPYGVLDKRLRLA